MWKYKFCSPFGGYGDGVLLMALLSMFLGIPLTVWTKSDSVWFFILPPMLILAVSFLIVHHPSKEDRQKIRSASPLQWKLLLSSQLAEIPESDFFLDEVFRYGAFLFVMGMFTLAAFIKKAPDLGIIGAVVFVVGFLYAWHEVHFWSHLDETAEAAWIPVDHFYYVYSPNMTRSRRLMDKYAILVCYLPDGKYQFRLKENRPASEKVRLIRYKGRIRLWY